MSGAAAYEFTCAECRRHVAHFGPTPLVRPGLCVTCISYPGWFNDPKLRAILDPAGVAKPEQDDARKALMVLQGHSTMVGILANELAGKLILAITAPHMVRDLAEDLVKMEEAAMRQLSAIKAVAVSMLDKGAAS